MNVSEMDSGVNGHRQEPTPTGLDDRQSATTTEAAAKPKKARKPRKKKEATESNGKIPALPREADPPPESPNIDWGSHTRSEDIAFLLDKLLPEWGLVVIQARTNSGKSSFIRKVAACLTGGPPIPGWIGPCDRRALFCTNEESWNARVYPSLEAAGAHPDRVGRFRMRKEDGTMRRVSLPGDIVQVRHELSNTNAGLLSVDPYANIMASTLNPFMEPDVRKAYEPLVEVLEETRTLCLVTQHLNNGRHNDPMRQGLGGQGISNVGCMTIRFEKLAGEEGLFCGKVLNSNISDLPPAIIYRLRKVGEKRVVWEFVRWEEVDDQALLDDPGKHLLSQDRKWLIELIVSMIGRVGISLAIILDKASAHGWSKDQVKHYGLRILKVTSQKVGFGAQAYQQWGPPKGGWPKEYEYLLTDTPPSP